MSEVYSLERELDSLDFTIHPDPDQCSIFDYLGPDFDYESIRLESDVICDQPQLPAVVYRDTGVPMGFRHWKHAGLDDTIEYYVQRLWIFIKEAWDKLWQ